MRKNITLPAVMLIGLSLTCLTLVGQSREIVHDVSPIKADATGALLRSGDTGTFLQAGVGNAERFRNASRLRAAGSTTKSVVSYSATGDKQSKEVGTYNDAGLLTKYEQYSWDGSAWIKSSKSEYEYDNNGREALRESYREEGDQWVGSEKVTKTYDNGMITSSASYTWKDNVWVMEVYI
jgi:hypothetical protein